MEYLQPTSLTWWAGVLACATGIGAMLLPGYGALPHLAQFVALLAGSGDASPAGLVFLGLGLIGLRARLERGFRPDG